MNNNTTTRFEEARTAEEHKGTTIGYKEIKKFLRQNMEHRDSDMDILRTRIINLDQSIYEAKDQGRDATALEELAAEYRIEMAGIFMEYRTYQKMLKATDAKTLGKK